MSVRRRAVLVGLLSLISSALAASACRERVSLGTLSGDANIVTQVHEVRPATERAVAKGATVALRETGATPATAVAAQAGTEPSHAVSVRAGEAQRPEPDAIDEAHAYCRQVEQQARETNAGLPKRLDGETSATRVVAYGCDVVLEYAMLDLKVKDVAAEGVRALRLEVLHKLCSDRGARGVMNHGGSFTNVYRDEQSALIDQFTIGAEDCSETLSADHAPAPLAP